MWPFSKKKPIGEAFGNIKIGSVLGASDKQFIKELKVILPNLTKKEVKAILKHMRTLGTNACGYDNLMVVADEATFSKAQRRRFKPLKYLTYTAGCGRDCCDNSWAQGCCGGPSVGGAANLENSYYILEYIGVKDFT